MLCVVVVPLLQDANVDSDIQISMPDESSDAPDAEEEDATETEIVPETETNYNPVRESQIPKATGPPTSMPIAPVVEAPQTLQPIKQEVMPESDSVETTNSGESGSASDSEESADQTGESGNGDSSGNGILLKLSDLLALKF